MRCTLTRCARRRKGKLAGTGKCLAVREGHEGGRKAGGRGYHPRQAEVTACSPFHPPPFLPERKSSLDCFQSLHFFQIGEGLGCNAWSEREIGLLARKPRFVSFSSQIAFENTTGYSYPLPPQAFKRRADRANATFVISCASASGSTWVKK